MKIPLRRTIHEPTSFDWQTVKHGAGLVVHKYCNIYGDTILGENVRIGGYTEISGAKIGNNVVIGAKCFIPKGVIIEDDAWIGPGVFMTNDKFPPSSEDKWQETIIRNGARIGAAVTIVCGVEIGENALIGAGSVVTKNIPPFETWVGVPAKKIKKRREELCISKKE